MAVHRSVGLRDDGSAVYVACECGWAAYMSDEGAARTAFAEHLDAVRSQRERAEAGLRDEVSDPDRRTRLSQSIMDS